MELLIGRVIKPHGIRGELVVEITTDDPESRFEVGTVLVGRQGKKQRELTIASTRAHQKRLLVTFEEIADRNEAETLRGMKFFAEPSEDEDEGYYDHQLEGLEVIHNGAKIGTITGVMHVGPRTILEMGEVLIPFVHDIVPEVNLKEGSITITPPEGLLEL